MRRIAALPVLLLALLPGGAHGATTPSSDDTRPPALREIGIDQRLGESLPLDAPFRDEGGRAVTLGDYFGAKPVVLVLTYFECPMLCTLVLNGLTKSLKTMSFEPGKEFDVVAVSFDPRDTPELAARKKATYLGEYGRAATASGWHFLTGDEAAIARVATAVGFRYRWVPEEKQFAHAAAVMVATPEGRLARYFYGIDYAPRDLRLGLVEAADHKIGSAVDALLLFCYHYDPATGKYGGVRAEPGARRRRRHGAGPRRVHDGDVPSRGGRRAPAPEERLSMLERLGLMPPQASTVALQVDLLYLFLVLVSAFFSLLIAGSVVFFAVRYRRRSPNERTPHIHGSTALEVAWSIVPFGITMIMFFWGAHLFITLKRPPDDALVVNVVGKQWMWKIQHLEGRREINELHVPLGRPVKLTLTSEDVIHSFYVPAFRIKQDAVPGRYTTTWFEATKTGSFHLFCAEYCGTVHSGMIGHVVVMDPADYQAWLAGAPAQAGAAAESGGSLADAGKGLFEQLGCETCHRAGSVLGPALAGIVGKAVTLQDGSTVTADDAYLRESILNPQAKVVQGFAPVMPTFKGQIDEEQILQLIAYLKERA